MLYRFGDFELHPAAYTLRRKGREVEVRPKVFDLLRYLIEHRDRVVLRDELLSALWPNEHVGDASVAWTVSHLRKTLGQARGDKRPIETLHGRGYRFRGPIEVIALAAPTEEVTHAGEPTATPLAEPSARRPFVGRVEPMRRLGALLQDAAGGHGGLCLLHGEAGIGKTRCVEELARTAARAAIPVWQGRAVEGASAPVFWPWIQVLRAATQSRPELQEASKPLLSELTALAGAGNRDETARPDHFWLLDDVTRLLLCAARKAPAVVILEDLHWADAGTLDLLKLLSAELSASCLVVIGTARTRAAGELDPRVAAAAHRAERIEIKRLSAEDVADYVVELTGMEAAPAALVQALHRITAGNPLLVQEALRTLSAQHGEGALGTLREADLQLRGVLDARLARLSAAQRALLACASALGEAFDLSLLLAVSGLELVEALELLERSRADGLLLSETPRSFRFSHALFRDLLYDQLAPAERLALHRRAAEALETLPAIEPRESEIAHHYYRSLPAGASDRAAAAARRAAEAAESVGAFEDAVRFYGWALEAQALDEATSPRELAELLLAAGRAERLAGRRDEARKTLGRMFELARRHRFADLVVRGVRALRPTPAMSSLPDPEVRDALEDLLQSPEPLGATRVRALAQLACVPPYAMDLSRSKQMTARALDLARETGDRSLLLEVLCARFYALSGPDDTDALLATADEVLEAEGGRPTPTSIEAHCARAGALIYRGEIAAADQAFAIVGEMSNELRLREGIWYCKRQAAQRRFLEGRFDAAEAACAELYAQGMRFGLYYASWFTSGLTRAIAMDRGAMDRGQGEAAADDFSILTRLASDVHLNVKAQLTRAAAELGRMESARLGVDALATLGFETFPKDIAYLSNLASVAVAVAALGDRPRAEKLYELLAPYADYNTPDPTLLYGGSVSRYLALLAACAGHDDEVEAHFESALAMNRRMGQRAMVARTGFEYARWLSGRRGGSARARALSKETAELSGSLGMAWLEERARKLAG